MRPVSEVTRSNIISWLKREGISWHGKITELDFLRRVFKRIDSLPSEDPRFRTFIEDYGQHRINNDDWPEDWIYTDNRFNLLTTTPSLVFLAFLCEMIHPLVRTDPGEVVRLLRFFNEHLAVDRWSIEENRRISGRPLFKAISLTGTYIPPKELLSIKTRYEFENHLTSWIMREIEIEFDSADIIPSRIPPKTTSQRRGLVESYYMALDLTSLKDAQKLLKVFESILNRLSDASDDKHNPEAVVHLTKWLNKDGWEYINGKLVSASTARIHPELMHVAKKFDSEHMFQQIKRIEESIDVDPSLAIGSSKELIETCCKTILKERKVAFDENSELPKLVKAAMKELNLLPDNIPDQSKGAETIKRVLSNLASVMQGIAELRNLYGTGHGRSFNLKGLSPRHAKLAAGTASTLAVFLFETHSHRQTTA